MDYFRRLQGHQRGTPGLEWKLFKKLPWALMGGTIVPLLIGPDGTFTLNHTYAVEGDYELSVEVKDDGGAAATASIRQVSR